MNEPSSTTDGRMVAAKAKAELSYGQALWYAWGRIDSGEYKDQDVSLDAFKFAESVKAASLSFELQETFFLESIQGAWDKFVVAESS